MTPANHKTMCYSPLTVPQPTSQDYEAVLSGTWYTQQLVLALYAGEVQLTWPDIPWLTLLCAEFVPWNLKIYFHFLSVLNNELHKPQLISWLWKRRTCLSTIIWLLITRWLCQWQRPGHQQLSYWLNSLRVLPDIVTCTNIAVILQSFLKTFRQEIKCSNWVNGSEVLSWQLLNH